MQGLESAILENFQSGHQESFTGILKIFLFRAGSYESLVRLEGKTEEGPFLKGSI